MFSKRPKTKQTHFANERLHTAHRLMRIAARGPQLSFQNAAIPSSPVRRQGTGYHIQSPALRLSLDRHRGRARTALRFFRRDHELLRELQKRHEEYRARTEEELGEMEENLILSNLEVDRLNEDYTTAKVDWKLGELRDEVEMLREDQEAAQEAREAFDGQQDLIGRLEQQNESLRQQLEGKSEKPAE
ncbi:MAG: hypothetical protein M1819_006718 [Sarea resinae]|nr:MAG: hypothetical protein M1819_006718 [Sarea resinae]